jgi:hypothetical protein
LAELVKTEVQQMVPQHVVNFFLQSPKDFMRSNIVFWQGHAPENQDVITVVMKDAGTGRMRTGSKFLGMGNAKATIPKYVLNPDVS